MRVAAILVVLSSVAHAGPVHELRASGVEPGHAASNLFDADPTTTYCAPAGHASIRYVLSDADAAALADLTEIELAGVDRDPRDVAIEVYYPWAQDDKVETITVTANQTTRVLYPRKAKQRANEILIRIGTHARGTVCLGEIVFRGASGPIALPDLRAAVDRDRARTHEVGGARELKTYVTAFSWIYYNPHKMTSTWESALYDLHDDGTYTATRSELTSTGARAETGTWSLSGSALRVGSLHFRLGPCRAAPGYVCSADSSFVPTASQ